MLNNIDIINQVDTADKVVALTFDDGPNPTYTSEVLEIFEEVSGKATFYMIGEQMVKHPEIVSSVVKRNHEIGNHTFSHPMLTDLDESTCYREIEEVDKIIYNLTGMKPKTFRPPYLAYNDEIHTMVKGFDYSVIGALNLDAKDWEQPGAEFILSKTRNHVGNGSILLFHDGFGDRSQSMEAVRKLVAELTERGYQLVTVSELLKRNTLSR